ncbi:MAG: hypothetical protein FWC95_01120 [Defluviitaleaceae bacterium]|nr:hypothetical protein [Defluviitaleaceae bacterium]
MKQKEMFIAFYPSKKYWAGDIPNFKNIDDDSYMKIMSAIEYSINMGQCKLKIAKDGMIMFYNADIEHKNTKRQNNSQYVNDDLELWNEYLNYLNAIYLVFTSSYYKQKNFYYFDIHEITNSDCANVTFENSKFIHSNVPGGFGKEHFPQRFISKQTLVLGESYDVLDKSVIGLMEDNLLKIINSYEKIKILSLIMKSLCEYHKAHLSVSLLLSWFIIEFYVNERLNRFLEIKGVNKERRKIILDYAVSEKLNILEISGEMNSFEFKRVDKFRKRRNKIVHESVNANRTDIEICIDALKYVIEMFNSNNETDIVLDMCFQYKGLL